MGCKPCEKRKAQEQAQQKRYKVVAQSGRVVYRTNDAAAAERMTQSYTDSKVIDTRS